MTEHQKLREEIPAYVAGRLGEEAIRELENHLIDCAECSELRAGFEEIADSILKGGDALFEPHPTDRELMDYALNRDGPLSPEVTRHLDWCALCELVVAGWRQRTRTEAPRSRIGAIFTRPGLVGSAALAAGVILGFVLSGAVRPVPSPESKSIAALPGTSGRLLYLRVLRGATASQTLTIGHEEPYFNLAVQFSLPPDVHDTQLLRFEVRRADGVEVWTSDYQTAEWLRRQLDSVEVVTHPIPTENLLQGEYSLRLVSADSRDRDVLRIDFQIVRAGSASPR